jgi:2-C-methyl-D-erythritol 4-phosphate cytidylyltransferase / 2-C-methyl-D-erythritol 2,4-cyclodiphosphate synthase
MPRVYALIMAAGKGQRFTSDLPKQYWQLGGKTILRHSIEAFLHHPKIQGVQVVIHPDHQEWYDQSVSALSLLPAIYGQESRQGSVYAGLQALSTWQPDYVLIHDAARPFVTAPLIDKIIEDSKKHNAAIPVIPVVDTLKQAVKDRIKTIPRHDLYQTQTPQGFSFDLIVKAHEHFKEDLLFTDDASLIEALEHSVALTQGEPNNFKITTKADYFRGQQMQQDIRVGNGFDVHAFETGPGLTLGGVFLDCGTALKGHSDADVVLHAITDAILGTIGAGDIGQHFPPSDPQWRGVASKKFVAHALELLYQKSGRLNHIDVTVIGEQPKISPHRDAILESLSMILNIPQERISLKATTTEKLGFTGRKEGLAALATVTVLIGGQGC